MIGRHSNENIWEEMEKINMQYEKIKVYPKCIGVITNNNYYLVAGDTSQGSYGGLSELIRWNVLPKNVGTVNNSIRAIESKRRMFKNLFFLPLQLAFLDFLSH
jgi:hypothetical protein